MKSLTLRMPDDVTDCVLDCLQGQPSTELEGVHKSQYGWSDETYQKILALRNSITDIGAIVSGDSHAKQAGAVTRMKVWNSKTDEQPASEIIMLKLCNYAGVRFQQLQFSKTNNDITYPFEVFAVFRDAITDAQQRDLTLMTYGFLLK